MSTATPKSPPATPEPAWPDSTNWPPLPGEPPLRPLPDDTQLPVTDGTFVKNVQEHPQSILLTDSIEPILRRRHPDGQSSIGQDCAIYWRLIEPFERGAVCPDWAYFPDLPPKRPDGRPRRSYVMWQEVVAPLVLLEFVSGNGSEERDRTPITGKFWIYERAVRPAFYGIYEAKLGRVEVYQHIGSRFQLLPPNERGRYPIPDFGVELGIWRGRYLGLDLPWLRWWDAHGNLLLLGHEIAEVEQQRAEQERQRADRLAAQLRALGVEPEG